MIGLRYKYGDKAIFDSFEKCISLVREYPIVYTFLPVEYKNKETGYIEVLKSYMTILMTKIFRKMESDNVISEKTKIPPCRRHRGV